LAFLATAFTPAVRDNVTGAFAICAGELAVRCVIILSCTVVVIYSPAYTGKGLACAIISGVIFSRFAAVILALYHCGER
jgi:hypothetical protein